MFYNLERVPSKTCYVEARARTPNRDRAHEITKSDCKTRKRHKIHVVHPIQRRPQTKASESFTIQRGVSTRFMWFPQSRDIHRRRHRRVSLFKEENYKKSEVTCLFLPHNSTITRNWRQEY